MKAVQRVAESGAKWDTVMVDLMVDLMVGKMDKQLDEQLAAKLVWWLVAPMVDLQVVCLAGWKGVTTVDSMAEYLVEL